MEIHTHVLQDMAGGSHIVEILAHGLLVDGQETAILSYSQQEITLASPAGIIHCSAEQFWRSLVGADPSIAEAGSLLAQCLAHWMAFWRARQQIEASAPPLTLPQYRFSPFITQLLATLDGTPEQAEAVARILRVPVETVLSWAEQQQQRLPVGVLPEKLVEADAGPQMHESWTDAGRFGRNATTSDTGILLTHARPDFTPDQNASAHKQAAGAGGSDGNGSRFRWSSNRVSELTTFVRSLQTQDIDAQSVAAAKHFDWPVASVRAKLAFIQSQELPETRPSPIGSSHPREHAASPEDD